jgi:hypothetical protein
MRKLSIDDRIDIRQELLALSTEIDGLHLLQVDQVVVLVLHYCHSLRPLTHLSLAVFQHRLAKQH